MNDATTTPRRLAVGSALLASILLYGVYGVAASVLAGEAEEVVRDDVYEEECGACHLAYVPGLLPPDSWHAVMSGLSDHFGEDALLEQETHRHVAAYLQTHALRPGQKSRASKFLRNLPDKAPLRITELPGFIQAHQEVADQLGAELMVEGFLSPCEDCHREADQGLFDHELLGPGYGPQTWSPSTDASP